MAERPVGTVVVEARNPKRPPYEAPRIQQMTERDILNTFQITQSMSSWWTTGAC